MCYIHMKDHFKVVGRNDPQALIDDVMICLHHV